MIALIQRVAEARVEIGGEAIGSIDRGILAFIGVQKDDSESSASRLLDRVLGYRIFPDQEGRMNCSLAQIDGGLLLVPQFTLAADTHKGTRPGFSSAAPPEKGAKLFELLVARARTSHAAVETGRFGADMKVHLVNDGPVTFWLEVRAAAS